LQMPRLIKGTASQKILCSSEGHNVIGPMKPICVIYRLELIIRDENGRKLSENLSTVFYFYI
jgi:hypothetical protein